MLQKLNLKYVISYLFIVMRSDNTYFIAKCFVQNMFKNIRKYKKKRNMFA